MANNEKDPGDSQDPLEKHSLPGTNQAGKGPGASDEDDQENGPPGGEAAGQDPLEDHSLPGTNQAGKGPGPSGQDD